MAKNSAIARFTFKRHTNNKIKTHNKTHMNKKAHKGEIYTDIWSSGKGRERGGVSSESIS